MTIRVIFGVLGLALCLSPVWAAIPSMDQSGWSWSEENTLQVSGARISERRWRASVPQAQAARQLSEHFKFLDRMLILDGRIVLSGLVAGHHWLAEVLYHPSGSQGVISVLGAGPTTYVGFDFSPYLPRDTETIFQNVEVLDNRTITRAAYQSDVSKASLLRHFGRALSGAGWRREAGSGATLRWWRGKAQLDMQIRAELTGAQLWIQHIQEPGAS